MIWPWSELEREIDYLQSELKDIHEKYWAVHREIDMIYDYLGVVKEKQVVRERLTKKGGPEKP